MGWVKMDDRFGEHPKVTRCSLGAKWLFVEALCYANRNHTDGLITTAVARKLGNLKSIAQLVAVGLWEQDPAGYRIHDYLDYNPSKEEVIERRRQDSERKRSGIHTGFRSDSSMASAWKPGTGRGKDKQDVPEFTKRLLRQEGP